MDFGWTPEDNAFRSEVRSFIRKTIPPNWDEMNLDEEEEEVYAQEFARKLLPTKWRVMHWPEAYGGLGYGAWRQLIFSEEVTYHRFPGAWDGGNMVVAPLLMHAGTDDQKRRFLGPIANADYSWCQLFTEPESGSDLASLRTRAVLTGDDYVVNGQKVFNTGAHLADWGLLACRTDTEVPKHRGISFLLVDMKSPGVTVRPLINLTGAHAQNEVFLEDVRVPKDHLVGRENEGWYLLVSALSSERGGINRATQAKRLLDDVTGFVASTAYNGRPIGKRPEVRNRLAELAIAIDLARWVFYRAIWAQVNGMDPTRENSASKIMGGEVSQRLASTAMNMMGLYGQLNRRSKYTPLQGRIEMMYKETVYYTIGLGTSEINRNVIAQRGLGLPRG